MTPVESFMPPATDAWISAISPGLIPVSGA